MLYKIVKPDNFILTAMNSSITYFLRVSLYLLKDRGEDGYEEVEQHHIAHQEVDCQEEWGHVPKNKLVKKNNLKILLSIRNN